MTSEYDNPSTWPDSKQRHALIVFAQMLEDYIKDNANLWTALIPNGLDPYSRVNERLDQLLTEARLAPDCVEVVDIQAMRGGVRPYRVELRWVSAIDRLSRLVND